LIHDATHYIAENAELKEEAEFDTKLEGLLNVGLTKVENQSYTSISNV
jgi:hypothetical protein